MSFAIVNSTTNGLRRETLYGRPHLVTSAVLIVPGVLNGSQGRLFYPPDEVTRDAPAWNAMPIVAYHPQNESGEHISARDPAILNDQGLGVIFRSGGEGKLESEAWFDEAAVRNYDSRLPKEHRILPRLESGKPIELSTGLFTENEKAADGAVFNGEPYDFIARNYKPDHVAILPDQKGACSNDDGCGINVNERKTLWQKLKQLLGVNQAPAVAIDIDKAITTNQEDTDMNRKKTIAFLTANCDCWKGEEKTLETLADDKLEKLAANARVVLVVNAVKKNGIKALALNADGDGEVAGVDIAALAEFLGIMTDPASDPVGFVKELQTTLGGVLKKLGGEPEAPEPPVAAMEEEEEEEMVAAAETETVTNKKRKPLSDAEWLRDAPPKVKAAVRNAMAVEQSERERLVERLTANADESKRSALTKRLMAKDIDELTDLVSMLPAQRTRDDEFTALRIGASGGPRHVTNADEDEQDIRDMVPPVTNWAEEAKRQYA